MKNIQSYSELKQNLKNKSKSFLLLYKKGSETSDCAFSNFEKTVPAEKDKVGLLAADVTSVRDIHVAYNITTVPSLLVFDKGEFINTIKGCHDSNYYAALFENAIYQAKAAESGKVQKRVTVYSTPTCSWCNTLKSFLRKNGIIFTDIDVSRDENAAQEMVRRSGQQGVPQTDINGEMIVGFDQARIKKLLDIA